MAKALTTLGGYTPKLGGSGGTVYSSVKGKELSLANIDKFDKKVDQLLNRLIKKYGAKSYNMARQLVPVDSGDLRDSIAVRYYEGKSGRSITYTISANMPYAIYVEYGIGQTEQPYIRPAVDTCRAMMEIELRAELRRLCR